MALKCLFCVVYIITFVVVQPESGVALLQPRFLYVLMSQQLLAYTVTLPTTEGVACASEAVPVIAQVATRLSSVALKSRELKKYSVPPLGS